MNNKNKILVGCLALLLVLSVGYALFSESITINGTAKAKGNVELTVTEFPNSEYSGSETDNGEHGIVKSSNISINDNVVTTNVTLGAPGSRKAYIIKIENTGSIPVVFDGYENLSDSSVEEYDLFRFIKRSSDNKSTLEVTTYFDGGVHYDYEELGYWFENGFDPDEEPLSTAVLDPGESAYVEIMHEWTSTSTTNEEMTMNFKIKFNWKQVTAN